MRCASCGKNSPEGMSFCGHCGAPFEEAGPSSSPQPVIAAEEVSAEYRQLTVVFCDLVGSTALSEQLDPEALHDLVQSYQAACRQVIERDDGYIAQYLGDGILVYFGYPKAHEDDVQRALRAGLEIVKTVPEVGRRIGQELAVRVGIHTGPVVAGQVGAGATREKLALGRTPNLAARLQNLAEPNGVLVSATTHRLARGFFDFVPRGALELKGLSGRVEAFEVVAPRGVESRFEAIQSAGLQLMVGRATEQALLLEELRSAESGQSRAVLVTGEAGVGKSRLVYELKDAALENGDGWLLAQCSAYSANTAFFPLVDLLRRYIELDSSAGHEQSLEKLEGTLESLGLPLSTNAPLLADLLDLPLNGSYPPLDLDPQRQKQETMLAVVAVLDGLTHRAPLVLVVEDLHWADPTTIQFLESLMNGRQLRRSLLLLSARTVFSEHWAAATRATPISLGSLSEADIEGVAMGVTGGKPLPREVMQRIVEKTDGVPLFIEELTRVILESGDLREGRQGYELRRPLEKLQIPDTIQDSLVARLDRLPSARKIAQLGAVIGRQFSYRLLWEIAGDLRPSLQPALAELAEAGLLFAHGEPPEASYTFKHALVQDAAYGMLLSKKRKLIHGRVAQAIEESFPEVAATRPELLAHHYAEAGMPERSAPLWLRAGEVANRRSASQEAQRHLRKGLELLAQLPESLERDRLELGLQMNLGTALITGRGYGAPGVEQAFARAQVLNERAGRPEERFWILLGLLQFRTVRATMAEAKRTAGVLVELAERVQDPEMVASASFQHGVVRFYLGEFQRALELFEAVPSDDSLSSPGFIATTGSDLRVLGLIFKAMALWHRGYPAQALHACDAGLEIARGLHHGYSLAMALTFGCQVRQFAALAEEVLPLAAELIRVCGDKGYFLWSQQGVVFKAWAESHLPSGPDLDAGSIAEATRQALEALRASGANLALPYFCAMRAAALKSLDLDDEARQSVRDSLEMLGRTHDRFWEADTLLLQGDLLLRADREDREEAAAACYEKAIEVAARQGSRSLELRAALALAELRGRRGADPDTSALVARLYRGFSEGLDQPDLRRAARLLAGG